MAQQLAFDLPSVAALGRDDFFVSDANALALSVLEDWGNWPNNKHMLLGAPASGKTHLAHVWAGQTQAQVVSATKLGTTGIESLCASHVVIEDADIISGNRDLEQALFHAHNLTLAQGFSLLITAKQPPKTWGMVLPDLASRMEATATVTLNTPDDALLSAVLLKLFADRQLMPAPTVTDYLARTMERSFAMAGRVVDAMDKEALATGRALNRGLAADILDKIAKSGA